MEGPKSYICLFIEEISGWVEAVVKCKKTEIPIMKSLHQELFCCYGAPEEIVIDGGELDAGTMREMAQRMGHITLRVEMAHGQQANGLVKKANVPIVAALAKASESSPKTSHQHLSLPYRWSSSLSFTITEWRRGMTMEEPLAARIRMLQRRDYNVRLAQAQIERARGQRAKQFKRENRPRPEYELIEEGDFVVVRASQLDN
ncbi:hypothetical protein HDU67_003649 [Dinochytrium kinnereticum]|nr:hypothetical protein HDU67_003649 [Dinochytrium kinnereticum]